MVVVWINGLDTRIYREELQSLIGFPAARVRDIREYVVLGIS